MKKIYFLMLFVFTGAIILQAQGSGGPDMHSLAQGPGGTSTLFSNDVIVAPGSSLKQHRTSLAVAFNGWLYEAFQLETMDSDSSGILVRMSKDNGFSWMNFSTYLIPNLDYLNPEIEVTGTDTNNLFLFLACANFDSASFTTVLYVDKYNARNGVFLGEPYNYPMLNAIRDIDLASDYRYPAYTSAPYSLGLLYSHLGMADTIYFVSSGDGGNTWGNRVYVARTSLYFDQVSLSYGIANTFGNGRYFAVWEERPTFFSSVIGKIKTAHCLSMYNDLVWSPVFCLDSLDASISGRVRNPRIATQYNSAAYNDSIGLTAAIVFERAYGGDTADCDILGFYNKKVVYSNYWYRFDVENNVSQTIQPDISYDPAYNNFLLTYFDRTGQRMPYLVHDFNMINPSNWALIVNNFCDQPSTVKNPFPRVVINEALTQAAFSWTSHATPLREQAMFDAEYTVTGYASSAINSNEMKVFPNPSNDQTLLTFNLENQMGVRVDIYDLNGRLVKNIMQETMAAGPQQVAVSTSELSAGTYLISLNADDHQSIIRLVVAH